MNSAIVEGDCLWVLSEERVLLHSCVRVYEFRHAEKEDKKGLI